MAGAYLASLGELASPPALVDLMPLDVMLYVMRDRFANGDFQGSIAAASLAAPYCHSRLTSSEVTVRNEYGKLSDRELAHRITVERQQIASRLLETTGKVIKVEVEPVESASATGN